MTDNKLPIEIDGASVDKLCLETAQLFAKYGINFIQNEALLVDLFETIGEFLEGKCHVIIKENTRELYRASEY